MESLYSVPAFPPELERQVFETYALLRPIGIPKLMLVAWSVKQWVEPFLYRTITFELHDSHMIAVLPAFTREYLSSALKSKPPSFFQHSIHRILLYSGAKGSYRDLLPAFTGLENLWAKEDLTDFTPFIAQLRLKHLYGPVPPLLRTLTPIHACFSQITHLD
ncbi:hypothetical protein C8R44DRAFT_819493 [Mycena epipterygia]|nr:hypothetical protein C8R44DRAFT_819493 [Mycena epipterygia]